MISSQSGGVLVIQSTEELWKRLSRDRNGKNVAKSLLMEALVRIAKGKLPRILHTKLLNWRTSQVRSLGDGIVTAEGGRLIFVGDWCYESSFEGCNRAAHDAASAAIDALTQTR